MTMFIILGQNGKKKKDNTNYLNMHSITMNKFFFDWLITVSQFYENSTIKDNHFYTKVTYFKEQKIFNND